MTRENYSSYAPKHGHLSTTTTLHGKYEHGIYTHPAGMVEVWYAKDQVNLMTVFKGRVLRLDLFPKQPLTPRQIANRARKFLLEVTQQ